MKIRFQITLTTTQQLKGCVPRNDDTAIHAVQAFGHILNTPERRNRTYGAREFAEMIAGNYDVREPRIKTIVNHLRGLELPPPITYPVLPENPSLSSIGKSVLA